MLHNGQLVSKFSKSTYKKIKKLFGMISLHEIDSILNEEKQQILDNTTKHLELQSLWQCEKCNLHTAYMNLNWKTIWNFFSYPKQHSCGLKQESGNQLLEKWTMIPLPCFPESKRKVDNILINLTFFGLHEMNVDLFRTS